MDIDDSLELAYFAGFFDGEGSISILEHTKPTGYRYMRLLVQVGCTNLEVLEWFQLRFGGNIYNHKRNGNRKQCYTWQLHSRMAANALMLMQPYLLVKVEQARLALEFQETMGQSAPIGKDILDTRQVLRKTMSMLNARGKY